MKTQPPSVFWQSPDEKPSVKKGENHLFWVAVQTQWSPSEQPKVSVYLANYINKPLELDHNGEPLCDDYYVNDEGDPVSSIGWHNQYDHPEFNGYYEPMQFSEQCKLLGWADYVPPVWNGEVSA